MKKKLSILGVLAMCALVLASCGKTKISSQDYRTYYPEDYETLNYLVSSKQRDSDFFANFVDGLVETDRLGNLVPCLATEYTNKTDTNGNTVWTFKIRNTDWVDSEGKVYDKVKAQDWVDAAKYILSPANNSGTVNLWFQFIVGAEDYYNSRTDEDATNDVDFNKVGIKAIDESTLEYTVIGQQAYFDSVLTYASFFPVNGNFLQECGTDFGKTKDDILYCGGYIMKAESKSSYIEMTKNEKYWDAEHVYINNVHFGYVASISTSTTRELYEQGEIDGFALSNGDTAGVEKYIKGGPNGTGTIDNPATDTCFVGKAVGTGVYAAAFNFDRKGDGTVADDKKSMFAYSTHTEATYANTQKAILNKNFRKMFVYGFDFNGLNEQNTGEGLGLTYQCKGWTIPELTVAGGKDYTWYFAKEFAAKNNLTDVDDVKQNLYNEATKDIIYNEAKAKEFAQTAYTELTAQGVTFPVLMETFGSTDAETQAYREEYCKKFEDAMTVNGTKMVQFVVYEPKSDNEETACFYYGIYDITLFTGWSADYADPLTFLNCFTIGGDMEDTTIGLAGSQYEEQILKTYTDLVKAANAISDPSKKVERMEAFAKAEYQLIYEDAIAIPTTQASATRVNITKVLPFTALRTSSGLSDSKYKYRIILPNAVTQAQYQAMRTAFREQGTNEALEDVIRQILDGKI